MNLGGKSLAVLTPMYGGMAMCNYLESFLQLLILCQQEKISFAYAFTFNESLVTRARNRLADEYLKNMTSTHALFIDADIGFEPAHVLEMLKHDKDIAGAPCSKKGLRWDRVVKAVERQRAQYRPDELAGVAGDFVFNHEPFAGKREIKLSEPQEMRNVGTGLMLVRRNVFEKFREAYPDRWYTNKGDPQALPGQIHDFFRVGVDQKTRTYDSEDYCFCQDAQAIGFKTWLMPWVKTTHMGSFKYVGDMERVAALVGEL